MARLARDQVARRANATTSHNVGRDSRRGVRFARVPMGPYAWRFCVMLASRGFVYHSAKTAGQFDHFHRDCRCKVVAGFPEMTYYWRNGVRVSRGIDPFVEGYDPDAYLRLYELQRDVGEARGTRRKEASERTLIRSNGDPAAEYYGPISETDQEGHLKTGAPSSA